MSGNEHKIKEVQRILDPVGVDIVPVSRKIEELQTQDVHALVRDKLIKAFHEIGRPLFVEHTGLYLEGTERPSRRPDPDLLGPIGSQALRGPRGRSG